MAEARSGTGQLQEQKKGLLIAVSASVDKIISHFGGAPPETPASPEEPEAPVPSLVQAHRTVRALCDHTTAGPDQLSFRRGEVLRVITTVDEDWLRCGRDGSEGLVPVGYTSLVL